MLLKWTRSRWLVAVAAVVLVAFVTGLAFGLSGADPTVAQEGSTDLPYPDKVVTPVIPYPTRDMTKRPITTEQLPSTAPVERWEAKTDAGSSIKPTTGNYLYLPRIDRYFIMPDDVELYRTIQFGSCYSETRCPVFPILFYQRGEARIAIDQVGQVFEEIEGGGGDASAFPFFTGKED